MPSKRDVTVKALSSNLLQMKFMKRSVLHSEKEQEKESFKDSAEYWVIDEQFVKAQRKDLDIQPSHALCEDLVYGRMSFKGFNPAIEKIMRSLNGEESDEEKISAEDQQFAENYASVSSIAKKFTTKKERTEAHQESKLHSVSKQPDLFKRGKQKFKGRKG